MTTIEKLTQLMTTTPDEDKQYLNEVIEEIKVKHLTIEQLILLMTTIPDEDKQDLNEEIKVERPRGRPRIFTPEEKLERKRASDRRIYNRDPQKKIEANRQWRQQLKLK